MAKMEQIELDRHREQLAAEVKNLVENYRSIFEWDIQEIDEMAADKLILGAVRQALDTVGRSRRGSVAS